MKLISRALLAAALVISASAVMACSVPVFRYALERWPADPYEMVVFHRGPLSSADRALIDALERDAPGQSPANVDVQTIDLDADPPQEAIAFWKAAGGAELPWIVVRYPSATRIPVAAWSGGLNAESVALIVNSPRRREIARRLLAGDTAVWVLLQSGDAEKDVAAMAALDRELSVSQKELTLPDIDPQDAAEYLSAGADELKLQFSTMRVSRSDPAEQALVSMLLGTEPDLREFEEPMAFPVFGRGRVLYALIGAGINGDTIRTACQELVGPCTCQVKEQNPGVDLLMAVDWDRLIETKIDIDRELPPLPGLAGLSAATDDAETSGERGGRSDPLADGSASVPGQAADLPKPSGTSLETTRGEVPIAAPVLRNTLIAGGLGAICVIVGSLWMLSRQRGPSP